MKVYSFKEKNKHLYFPLQFLKSKCCWLLMVTIMVCFSFSIEAAHFLSSKAVYHRSMILDLAAGLGIVAAGWLAFSLLSNRRRRW